MSLAYNHHIVRNASIAAITQALGFRIAAIVPSERAAQ
jgi:hypothetical protein